MLLEKSWLELEHLEPKTLLVKFILWKFDFHIRKRLKIFSSPIAQTSTSAWARNGLFYENCKNWKF